MCVVALANEPKLAELLMVAEVEEGRLVLEGALPNRRDLPGGAAVRQHLALSPHVLINAAQPIRALCHNAVVAIEASPAQEPELARIVLVEVCH